MNHDPSNAWARTAKILGALALAVALSGCVVEAGGHSRGYCWWHPAACGR